VSSSSYSLDNAARRVPCASLLFVLVAAAASLVPGVAERLQFDRAAIAGGQWWRLVTSHFVHWSSEHLFWDLLAFAVLGWLCERDHVRAFLRCVAYSAVLIPLVLAWATPDMTAYRGLSGIDSALFALLAVRVGHQAVAEKDGLKLGIAGVVAAGFAAKVGFELLTGTTLFVDSSAAGMTPVPLAHVVGGFIGLGCGVHASGYFSARQSRRRWRGSVSVE
jgi:rhomboid family GlyGly-CTERM serine protease